MNGAFIGLVQRLVVPNETNARHGDATNLRETENTKNEAQVLAASIGETANEKRQRHNAKLTRRRKRKE